MFVVLCCIVLILVLILFLPLKVVVSGENKNIFVKVYIANLRLYKFSWADRNDGGKGENVDEQVQAVEKETKKLSNRIKLYYKVSKVAVVLAKKFISINDLWIDIKVGTGDAPSTAVSTGVLWGSVYSFLGILGSIMYVDNHKVEIVPIYSETVFTMKWQCIFKSKLAYIIFIAIIILVKIKSLKGKED